MKEKPLKASDIAQMAGITATEMKRITEQYGQVIPSRIFGRVKLYEQKAADIVEKISSMEAGGEETEDIIRQLGGKIVKKSTREKAGEKIRKNQNAGTRGSRGKDIKISGGSNPADTSAAHTPGAEDKAAFLELRLKKLTNRIESLEKKIESERQDRTRERDEFRKCLSEIAKKLEKTDEWIDYFDMSFDEFSSGQEEFNNRTREWIDFTDEEIGDLRKPFWRRKKRQT